MSLLLETLEAIKDEKLDKTQIERYRDMLASMFADMKIEAANLEKLEALYYMRNKTEEKSTAQIKYEWKATPEGQRLILLKAYTVATSKVIDSLKGRIYSLIM